MARSVMTTVDPDLGQKVGAELERNGVRVLTGQAISSISGGKLRFIEGANHFAYAADMILVAVGHALRPKLRLLLAF